jgi:hypothetical protein
MSSELLKLPRSSVSPHTIAQMSGSVVVMRKIPRSENVGSFSKTASVACTSVNGRTSLLAAVEHAAARRANAPMVRIKARLFTVGTLRVVVSDQRCGRAEDSRFLSGRRAPVPLYTRHR